MATEDRGARGSDPPSGAGRKPTGRLATATPSRPFVALSAADLTAPPTPAPAAGPRERYPWDLAVEVARQLEPSRGPGAEQLGALFEVLYFASLRTEEGDPVVCSVCWLDPELPLPPMPAVPGPRVQRTAKPKPGPPRATSRAALPCDGRTVVRFGQPIPLSTATLIKLSSAADPAASSLAVFPDPSGRAAVWGMIDQVRRDDAEASPRPGLFEATIAAPAHLVVTSHGRAVASLIHGQLTRRFHDVFRKGPIHRALDPFVSRFTGRVRAAVGKEVYEQAGDGWDATLRRLWLGTLGRVLLGVQAYRHGGALLLAPRLDAAGLRVKYALRYARLQDALVRLAVTRVERAHARDRLWRGYLLDADASDVPAELHIEEGRSSSAEAQSVSEISGCVRFVASLTRVDGLVAMDGDLAVHGFGAEITAQGDPPEVVLAQDAAAELTEPIDSTHFGTRHRSMMRYCAAQPGSVGLVVSQDGAIRAVTSHAGRIVLWEQIELVEPEATSDPADSVDPRKA